MNIQPSSRADIQGGPQHNAVSDSAGFVGNLQFEAEQNVSPRSGGLGAFSRLGGLLSRLNFSIVAAPSFARAPHETLGRTCDIGCHIRNLLFDLAAPASDARAEARIVQELRQISDRSSGNLGNLPGGVWYLFNDLRSMTHTDLLALRAGALGRMEVRNTVLGKIPPHCSDRASRLLAQMTKALDERLVQEFVSAPLSRFITLISTSPMDGRALAEQLNNLYTGMDLLDIHFPSLSEDLMESLLRALWPDRLHAAHEALLRMWKFGQNAARRQSVALSMLDHLNAFVERQIFVRAQPALRSVHSCFTKEAHLQYMKVAFALRRLDVLVNSTRRAYGRLPDEMAGEVRQLLKDGLSLLRLRQDDLDDPRLTDDEFKNGLWELRCLCLSLSSLRLFGFEPELELANAYAVERVVLFSRQLVEGMKGAMCTLSDETVDVSVFMRQLQLLAGLEAQRSQQLKGLAQSVPDGLGPADRRRLILLTCERAMGGWVAQEHDVLRHLALLNTLRDEFAVIASSVERILAQEGDKEGDERIIVQLTAKHQLLIGACLLLDNMIEAMHQHRLDAMGIGLFDSANELWQHQLDRMGTDSDASASLGAFYSALQEYYGLTYDPVGRNVAVYVAEPARHKIAPEL